MPRRWFRRLIPFALLMAVAIPGQCQGPARAGNQFSDAQRTSFDLAILMRRYPPELAQVFSIDPSLLSNQAYMAPYPDLADFLSAHPDVARNPSFYLGEALTPRSTAIRREAVRGIFILSGFAIALSLAVWLIRTIIDQRRWIRLNRIQMEAHSRILDRLSSNEELLTYIQSSAGSKFLESLPIRLDTGPQSSGAPVNRIIWTVQAGIVLAAGGGGFLFVASDSPEDIILPLHAVGILGIALGAGFVISAIVSFVMSRRFGLIEMPTGKPDVS